MKIFQNGRKNIEKNFESNFIQFNLHEEMMNDGEIYLNHVVPNVYLFPFV